MRCLNHALFYFSYYLFNFAMRIIYELMKKFLFIVVLALLSLKAGAQALVTDADGRYPVYCTIVCSNFWGIGKVDATIDFGGGKTWSASSSTLLGDDGKKLKFTSTMGAVNYMAKRGWKLDKTIYLTKGSSNVLHYIMVKYVKSDDEITEGINIKVRESKRKKTGDDMFDAGIED